MGFRLRRHHRFRDQGFSYGERGRVVCGVLCDYFLAEEVVVEWVCGDGGFGFIEGWEVESCADVLFYKVEGFGGVAEEDEEGFVEEEGQL